MTKRLLKPFNSQTILRHTNQSMLINIYSIYYLLNREVKSKQIFSSLQQIQIQDDEKGLKTKHSSNAKEIDKDG